MTDPTLTHVPAHPLGPTPGIKSVSPNNMPQAHLCQMPLHIGVFFDGTGNNQDWREPQTASTQLQREKDSNVARLYRAYFDDPADGYFRAYIPGVGTPFKDIGEHEPRALGAACGAGGDGRINFGLLHVINSIHQIVSPNARLYADEATVLALCRNGVRGARVDRGDRQDQPGLANPRDEAALRAVNMDQTGGLLLSSSGDAPQRTRFFKRACRQIAEKAAQHNKPKITEIFIDVYGFSRGATAARTFTNWLLELFEGDTLCGIPTKIRFLGLFDTVASVGVPASSGLAEGHLSWADAPWLRISDKVKNCVHYVAMHENRASFPVELVRQQGVLPSNCHEYMLPGMHSDVGGGYTPSEQGKSPNGLNEEKLSQLPLELMLNASLAAKVPLQIASAKVGSFDPFKVAANVRKAYEDFMSTRQSEQQIRDWMFEFIAWRYQNVHKHDQLSWYQRADKSDRDDVMGATRELQQDIHAFKVIDDNPLAVNWPEDMQNNEVRMALSRVNRLAKEARVIYDRLKSAPPVDKSAAHLFDQYAHDSFAGFRPYDQLKIGGIDILPGSWEPEGYLRWRRRYEGDDRQLAMQPKQDNSMHIASNSEASSSKAAA